jgi:hypothetical protein
MLGDVGVVMAENEGGEEISDAGEVSRDERYAASVNRRRCATAAWCGVTATVGCAD